MRYDPRFPIFIPSKSRHDHCWTARCLRRYRVPFRIIVEEPQLDLYRQEFTDEELLPLDPSYQQDYDTCDSLGETKSKGPGPARNMAWDVAIAEGHPWHWVMDDNIKAFGRFHKNKRINCGDGTVIHAMETFCLRYTNVAMAGPQYFMFLPSRQIIPPITLGSRVYSCNLIRNDVPFRWRGRYNEDTDLSLRMLKAGWQTVEFNAFFQWKSPTQRVKGGNTEAFYAAEGTRPKSEMLVRLHPDVAKMVWRYNRWHHVVDYSRWKDRPLVKREDWDPSEEPVYEFAIRPRKGPPWGMKAPAPQS